MTQCVARGHANCKTQVRFLSNGLGRFPVLQVDLSFNLLTKRNAAQIRIRTYFQFNGRAPKIRSYIVINSHEPILPTENAAQIIYINMIFTSFQPA